MKINWDAAEQNNDGKYLCRAKEVFIKTTKSNKEMWSVKLVIEQEGKLYGKEIYHNLVFGESSLWMVKRFYEASLGKKLSGEHDCQPSDLMDCYLIITIKGKNDFGPIITNFESITEKTNELPLKSEKQNEEEIPF